MADVQIVLKAVDRVTAEVKKIGASMTGLEKFTQGAAVAFTGISSAMSIASSVATQVQKVYAETISKTVEYGTQVDKLSRLIGENAEETSKLIQAADDAFISYEALSGAMEAATRKGIDVSIEGLANLADQYNSLAPGLERSKFLMDNFGRAGAEMGRMMEQGAEGIRAAGVEAEKFGLVMSQSQLASVNNYKVAIDNLGDAFQGFKYKVGAGSGGLIDQLTAVARIYTQLMSGKTIFQIDSFEELNKVITENRRAVMAAGTAQRSYADEENLSARAAANLAVREQTVAYETEKIKQKMQDLDLFMSGTVGKTYQNHITQMTALNKTFMEQSNELTALKTEYTGVTTKIQELEELKKKQYGWLTPKQKAELEELKTKQGEIAEKMREQEAALNGTVAAQKALKDASEKASKQIIFDLMRQQMAQDGLTTKESDALLAMAAKMGLIDEHTVNMTEDIRKLIKDFMDEKITIEQLGAAINGLPKYTELEIHTILTTSSSGHSFESDARDRANKVLAKGAIDWSNPDRQQAAGGIDTIPGGYPGDSYLYWGWKSSGEKVVTLPSNQAPDHAPLTGAGGGFTFIYSPTVSLGDRAEAERVIAPMMEAAYRKFTRLK